MTGAVRRHWRLVAACFVAALIVGALLVHRADRIYRTSATLFVTAADSNGSVASAYAGSLFTQERIASYVQLVDGPLVTRRVIDRLGLPMTSAALAGRISASSDPLTTLLTVTVIDESPERAQRIANTVGEEFGAVAGELEHGGRTGAAPIRVAYIDPAPLPKSPVAPRPMSDLPLAGFLGLVVGTGAALVNERGDTAVRRREEVEHATGGAIVGVVPHDANTLTRPLAFDAASPSRAEAYRALRTNLGFLGVDGPVRSVTVTSPTPGDGKSTTACNLGIAFAQAGLRVVVVDCDLREPSVGDYFGLESAAGLTTLLTGYARLDDVVQHWSGGVDVIASGAIPPNPGDLLATQAMRELVESLEAKYDVVLLDAPPLLVATDAALLAVTTSGTLLVVRQDRTRRGDVTAARRALDVVGARMLGSVVTATAPENRRAGYRGYASDDGAPAITSRPSFLGQTLGTAFSQAVLLVLTAASSIMAARSLGATGRGALVAATLGPGLVVALFGLGLEISNVYFVGRRRVRPDTALGTSAVVAAAVAVPALLGYLFVAAAVRVSLLRGISWSLVVLGSLLVPLLLISRYAVGVAQGLRRIGLVNLSTVGGTFTTVVLYAILLVGLGGGPLAALVAVVAGAVTSAAVVVVGLLRACDKPRWSGGYAREGLRFGLRGHVGNVITMLTYRVDVFIVTAMVGLAAAGQYAVAYTTTELLWQIPNAIAMILFPRIAQAGDEGAEVAARLCRLSLAGTALLAITGALIAPAGIPFVFSEEFRPAVPALIWLLPGIVLFAAGKLLSAYLTGRGRPDLPSRAAAVALPVVVVLDLVLIKPFGITGAAVASSAAYAIDALLLAIMFRRHAGLPWSALWRVRWSDFAVVGASARQLVQARRASGAR